MDAAPSCEFNQSASLQIRKGLPHIGGKHFKIDVVFLGQRLG